MAILITGRPDKTRNGYNSIWVAANNPISFTFTTTAPLDDAVQVSLFEVDGFTQIIELQIVPFAPDNTVNIDVSSFLQSELNSDNDSFTDVIMSDALQTNKYKQFRVGFRANGSGSYTVDSTEYIAVNNVKQANEEFGGNLARYIPDYDNVGNTVTQTGGFLTTFEKPVVFWYSPNPNPASGSEVTLFRPTFAWCLPDEYKAQANYKVRSVRSNKGTVQSTVVEALPLVSAMEGLRYANYVTNTPNVEYQSDQIVTSILTDNDIVLIDELTIEVRRICNNPTLIKWMDKLGSWQTWAFDGDAPFGHSVESGDTVGIPFNQIQTLPRTSKTINKRELPTLSISARNLSENEVLAISGIATSPNVLICTDDFLNNVGVPADNWVSVNVIDADRPLYNRVTSRYTINFELELIQQFTINN